MAATFTGKAGCTMAEDGDDFDPSTGATFYQIWRGPKKSILAKAAQFRAAGWKVSRQKWSGPFYQIRCTLTGNYQNPTNPGLEVPIDRYRITTELAQIDLRANPKLIAGSGSEADLALLIHDIDEALKDGLTLGDINISPVDVPVFNLRARGQQAYEIKRPVLTRIRSVSANYPRQFVIEPQPVIYKTAALIRVFGIPVAVSRRLAPDPAVKPSDTEWGWLWRQQDSDIVSTTTRVEEMDSWIFAAWSTATYDIVSV